MTNDILSIQGVEDVTVRQYGTSYEVSVTMGTFAFENYEKVIQEELALTEKHPHLEFNFHIGFAEHAADQNPSIVVA